MCEYVSPMADLVATVSVVDYAIPAILLFVLTVALAATLKVRDVRTSALQPGGISHHVNHGASRATLTVLFVSIIRCLVYLPYGVLLVVRG